MTISSEFVMLIPNIIYPASFSGLGNKSNIFVLIGLRGPKPPRSWVTLFSFG